MVVCRTLHCTHTHVPLLMHVCMTGVCVCAVPPGHPTWPDDVYRAFATAIASNPNPSLTHLHTSKDLAPFVPDVPQAVRYLNADAKSYHCFINAPLLKYISDERATKWRPRRDVLRVLCEVGQVGK